MYSLWAISWAPEMRKLELDIVYSDHFRDDDSHNICQCLLHCVEHLVVHEQTDKNARIAFLKTVPAERVFQVKGCQVSVTIWMNVVKVFKMLKPDSTVVP